jgi:hypothetical protein
MGIVGRFVMTTLPLWGAHIKACARQIQVVEQTFGPAKSRFTWDQGGSFSLVRARRHRLEG